MDAKYFFFLVFRLNFYDIVSTYENIIYISNSTGHDKLDCVKNSSVACKTLDFVLGVISNASEDRLRTSTKIQVQGNQSLKENYTLKKLNKFAFSGGANGSAIQCKFSQGLIIWSSNDIAIERLTFLNCGLLQTNQNNKDIFFHVGLFLSNITNINVTSCVISNSTGIGMALLNVGGHVVFTRVNFTGNINNSSTGSRITSGLAQVGGGLIIEFTYDNANVQSSSNNTYIFYNCTFIRNGCTWNTKHDPEPTEADANHVIFGCGGGIAMKFKGHAQSNTVHLESCTFRNNVADWGGGYYILFEEKSLNNSVEFKNVIAVSNCGVFSGGAGRFLLRPSINYISLLNLQPNYFKQENCSYLNNYAGWGGGVSVFGSSIYNLRQKSVTDMTFINSHWVNNRAVVGSALGFLSNPNDLQDWQSQTSAHGLAYTVKLVNCVFRKNTIHSNGKFMVGTGTIYVDESPIIMDNAFFTLNNGTPLVLDLSSVHIYGNVIFYNNSGNEGGAVALYGRSKIILGGNSSLNFTSNKAHLRGGAIYTYSQGPNLKAFQAHLLDRSTCFFGYYIPDMHPSNWSATVVFQNNYAPRKSGKSIYSDTLQFCRAYGNISEALEWKPVFKYLDNSTDDEPQIVTDPVEIITLHNNWVGFPGQLFSPNVTLLDEKRHETNGLLKMLVKSADSEVTLGCHVSEYIFISDGKSSVPISFDSKKQKGDFNLTLSSVYTQVIQTIVDNITTSPCYGGYKFDENKKRCVCLPQTEMPYGYRRCGQDGKTIFLKVGYWATIGHDGQIIVLPCPLEYCKCAQIANETSYGNNECVFRKFQRNSSQCAANRKGRLCGQCADGYSVVVGLDECRMCHSNIGLLWLLLALFGLTVFVLAIIYFEIDFFSGPLNSWLYIYHIVFILPYKREYLDPFITFVISLTRGTFDISTGQCVWKGMDALQKLTLEYLMPFYCILLLYVINKLLRRFPNLPLSNRCFHRAFVTIVILSYAALIQTTVTILHPVVVDGKWYVLRQAEVEYFGKHHLPYAIPALFILCFIVIPFPFVIAFSSYFTSRFQRLRNFIPLFEALQSPYRPNRSWFASYYIFCRLVFISLLLFRNDYEHTIFPLYEGVCVIILLIFVLLRPYNDDNYHYFHVDTCFLSLLCLIICGVNAMEANERPLNVFVFQVTVRIFVYIPFCYSMVLLIQYVYRGVQVYRQRRAERFEPLM